MKAYIRNGRRRGGQQQSDLAVRLEVNEKFGYGYQARMIQDGVETVLDTEPFTLEEATGGVAHMLEDINKKIGTRYELHKVLQIAGDAVEVNKGRDLASMRVANDIAEGKGKLTTPMGGHDYTKTMVDGKEEMVFSGRGLVVFSYLTWMDDKTPKAYEAMRRYCEYLAMQGYGGTATTVLAEMDALDKDGGVDWIRATYANWVHDDATIISYIMDK